MELPEPDSQIVFTGFRNTSLIESVLLGILNAQGLCETDVFIVQHQPKNAVPKQVNIEIPEDKIAAICAEILMDERLTSVVEDLLLNGTAIEKYAFS